MTKCLRCAKVIRQGDPYWLPRGGLHRGNLMAACSVECNDAAEVELALRFGPPTFEWSRRVKKATVEAHAREGGPS